ncbi:hypothetical protein ACFY00_24935 [Kitasatospora sp. NPDC001540]|uniref:hypothetical protein n=1 Tax=Kitasatospora sp. NPDC001540 TaxID=3364014 RepID=UPI0036CC23F0
MRKDVPLHAGADEKAGCLADLRAAMLAALSDPDLVDRWATASGTTHFGRPAPSLPFVDALPVEPEIKVRITAPRAELTSDPTPPGPSPCSPPEPRGTSPRGSSPSCKPC